MSLSQGRLSRARTIRAVRHVGPVEREAEHRDTTEPHGSGLFSQKNTTYA